MIKKQSEKQKCTSSTPKENSKQFDATVELGRKLIEELSLERSCNTLGRWMAHYVSELIIKAEQAVGEDKAIAEKKCFDAILDLWKHRAEFPNNKYPLNELEPLIRTIQSLDPDNDTPRYYKSIWQQIEEEEKENDELEELVELAEGIDRTARILIKACLASVAQNISDKSKMWVTLAEAAGSEITPEQLVIKFVSAEDELTNESDTTNSKYEEIKSLLDRLDAFSSLAKRYSGTLRDNLDTISSERKP